MMKTEWGVHDRFGSRPVSDLESAETIVSNMRETGFDTNAKVIWRGITEWQDLDNLDD